MPWKRASFTSRELERFARELRELKRTPKFLIDENIDRELPRVLRKQGLNVRTVSELSLLGGADTSIWSTARQQERIIVTSDRDYLDDRQFPIEQSPGVVIIPACCRGSEALVNALVVIVYVLGRHGEMWIGTKMEISSDDVFNVKMRSKTSGAIEMVRFHFRDPGPPFIWEK